MHPPVDRYTDELLTIYGTTPEDPLAEEIAELAGHARRLNIPEHFADLYLWVRAIHAELDCGGDDGGCQCFRSTAVSPA